MSALITTALFLPFLSFLFLSLCGSRLRKRFVGFIGCASVLIPFLIFAYEAYFIDTHNFLLFPWIHMQGIKADFIFHLDHLSLLMALIITGVGFLIHVYSIGYMEEDETLYRYFAFLNFFIFSMLLLVLAGDLLLLFVGWEGVGLASYWLIGYWYEKPSAAAAATKAFVVNRIGDFGFLLGILLTLSLFGTTNIEEILQQAPSQSTATLTLLSALLLCGGVAKSAQLPLHTWLPDAMEGPTPVSALIHAATMVTAGVYLIARLHALFLLAPAVMVWIGIIGGSTALFASLAALNQTDLKRVLAYSTVSQLGLMFLASGVGAFYAAMFHLTTHAFIKALLFLSAGNVIHMLHGTTEMDKMGGLSRYFKTTHLLFLIGVFALSGIPPFAAFFSKDLILEVEYSSGHTILFFIAVVTSILTGIYLTRAYFLTFRGQGEAKAAHEAPQVMLVPAKILAGLAIVGGLLGFIGNIPFLERYLVELGITHAERTFTEDFWMSHETWLGIIMAVGSVGFAAVLYLFFPNKLKNTLPILKNAFYIDWIYDKCLVLPYSAFAYLITFGFEPHLFLKPLYAIAFLTDETAYGLQKLQSGQIRSYAAWMVVGAVCLLLYIGLV